MEIRDFSGQVREFTLTEVTPNIVDIRYTATESKLCILLMVNNIV